MASSCCRPTKGASRLARRVASAPPTIDESIQRIPPVSRKPRRARARIARGANEPRRQRRGWTGTPNARAETLASPLPAVAAPRSSPAYHPLLACRVDAWMASCTVNGLEPSGYPCAPAFCTARAALAAHEGPSSADVVQTEAGKQLGAGHRLDAPAEAPHLIGDALQDAADLAEIRAHLRHRSAQVDAATGRPGDLPSMRARRVRPSSASRRSLPSGFLSRREDRPGFLRVKLELADPVAEGVAGQSQANRRERDVPARLQERPTRSFSRSKPSTETFRCDRSGSRRPFAGPAGGRRPRRSGVMTGHVSGKQGDPFEHVRQLPDVARPRIGQEGRLRFRGQHLRGQMVFGARSREVVLCQQQDIARPARSAVACRASWPPAGGRGPRERRPRVWP